MGYACESDNNKLVWIHGHQDTISMGPVASKKIPAGKNQAGYFPSELDSV